MDSLAKARPRTNGRLGSGSTRGVRLLLAAGPAPPAEALPTQARAEPLSFTTDGGRVLPVPEPAGRALVALAALGLAAARARHLRR